MSSIGWRFEILFGPDFPAAPINCDAFPFKYGQIAHIGQNARRL
jgi:hypothetical protein